LFSLIDVYIYIKKHGIKKLCMHFLALCHLLYISKKKSSGQCWLPTWNSSCHSHNLSIEICNTQSNC
jgi:hypothetical protein